MRKIFDKLKGFFTISKLKYKKLFKFLFILLIIIFGGLYIIAFFMKDYANHEWSRKLCQEYVNGPRNVVALILNKIKPETMSYKTNLENEDNKKQQDDISEKMLKDKDVKRYSF